MVNKKILIVSTLLMALTGKAFAQISVDTIVSMAFSRHQKEIENAAQWYKANGTLYFIAGFPSQMVGNRVLSPAMQLESVNFHLYQKWNRKNVKRNRMVMMITDINYRDNGTDFFILCGVLSITKKEKNIAAISQNMVEVTYECETGHWKYSHHYQQSPIKSN